MAGSYDRCDELNDEGNTKRFTIQILLLLLYHFIYIRLDYKPLSGPLSLSLSFSLLKVSRFLRGLLTTIKLYILLIIIEQNNNNNNHGYDKKRNHLAKIRPWQAKDPGLFLLFVFGSKP